MPASLPDLQVQIRNHPAIAVLFGAPDCGICRVLTPKLIDALRNQLPRLAIEVVDASAQPDVAAQFGVFSVPTLLVFFQGKEILRKSRVMGVAEVVGDIHRPYELLFADENETGP